MLSEIQALLETYNSWLRDKTSLRELKGWVEITTPYLDRHNDSLQIYVRPDNGGLLLTDDGHTIRDLEASGCSLTTPKRHDLLQMTLNGFGVRLIGASLEVSASTDNFPLRKHSLIQAMLAVNDLFFLAEPMVRSLFLEDVIEWMDSSDIRYTPKVKFTGQSGYDHVFDFVIPKSRQRPERIIRALNRPDRYKAESFMHAWADTKEVRAADSMAYALLNDTESPVPGDVSEGLKSYRIRPVPWSHRDQVRDELAA
ncbi:MAG TPA: DUF1829 domain-containing protein [Bryobacteraceae bacterium]|nr:DUF1829 domain-containing protein [Bryobacteraceae bacterium]